MEKFPDVIEITVTPEMANEEGVRFALAWDCPIARKMKRLFGLADFGVTVGPFGMEMGREIENRYQNVYTFDKPFDFDAFASCRAGKTFTTTAKIRKPEDAEKLFS